MPQNPTRQVHALLVAFLTLRIFSFYRLTILPAFSFCFDGQCLSEYEQNTQQSPALGRSIAPQLAH